MGTTFVAIDVETANVDRSSICHIGAVRIENGIVADTFATLVDPETYFDQWNTQIHGITAAMVRGDSLRFHRSPAGYQILSPPLSLQATRRSIGWPWSVFIPSTTSHCRSGVGWTPRGLRAGPGRSSRTLGTGWRQWLRIAASNFATMTRWRMPEQRGRCSSEPCTTPGWM